MATDEASKAAITAKLDDDSSSVRSATVGALVSLMATDGASKAAITAKPDDDSISVRSAPVSALFSQLNSTDREMYVNWLRLIAERDHTTGEDFDHHEARQKISQQFAQYLATEKELYAQVASLLNARAWPLRHGAAMTLIAMPGGPPAELLPHLRHLLEDLRGEESWPNRLTVAALFINERDAALSQHAIALCIEALDYATQPWYHLPQSGPAVRKQAALILGQLDPIYRNRQIFDRLARLMQEDKDVQVRDAAYAALMRLAAAPEEKR